MATTQSGNAASDLSTLSTRELLTEFRGSDNAVHKAAALKLIQEKNPHITHLAKIYTLAVATEVLRLLPSTDPQDNKFVPGAGVPVGKSFALTPDLLPNGATVEILEEDLHFQAPKPSIPVAKVKIIAVVSQTSKSKIGQIYWTTRSNISATADQTGQFKVIKATANIRSAPTIVQGSKRLESGRRLYIDEVRIDNFVNRDTFGLAVDADTQQEYGWITTTALVGKLDSEIFDVREATYLSKELGHNTVGDQSAAVLAFKGLYFAVQETIFAQNTLVKIVREDNHQGAKSITRVAQIRGADGTDLGWTTRSNLSLQADAAGFFKIIAPKANVRSAPSPVYTKTTTIIPQGALVQIDETTSALLLDNAGQFKAIAISKVSVIKDGKKDAHFDNVWTLSSNLVEAWADYKGPNALWEKGNYIGQTALMDVIGGLGTGGRQIAMHGGLGSNVEQMLRDAAKDNIPISINSGFRDYKKQEQLARDQPSNAAKPGRSDHQAGNSMDLNNKDNNPESKKVYEWLKQNAWKYGLVQTYPWFLGTDGKGGEGHHWDYRPELAKEGFYTYLLDRFNPGVSFGTDKGQIDPRVKTTETWMTGNAKGWGKGNFRIIETATGKSVKLRKN